MLDMSPRASEEATTTTLNLMFTLPLPREALLESNVVKEVIAAQI
jgi:hypothetical protein